MSFGTTALATLLLAATPDLDLASVQRAVATAERRWDADAAVAALSQARALAHREPGGVSQALQLRAGLLAAELLRVRFEEATEGTNAARQTLGAQIDAVAEEALSLLPRIPLSSERFRMEADLLATLIRSDFRAKKHETRFKEAVAKARALDPKNARAVVTAAKPLLFAPEGRGRDVPAGIALLDEALRLDPRLESALLLRAHARKLSGDATAAAADWRAALAHNPDCAPAGKALRAASGE